jgi:uncharacterized membrane protein
MTDSPTYVSANHQQFSEKAQLAFNGSRILFISLLLSITLWTLWLEPSPTANPWVIWLLQITPLALFIPGILKGKPRSHVWLCFVLLVYFCGSVMWSMAPMHRTMGITQGILEVGVFSCSMMYIRWNGKAQKARAEVAEGAKT